MTPYRFLPSAQAEMDNAAAYYEKAAAGLGRDFLNDVQRTVDRIGTYPEAGRLVTENFRSITLTNFPFSLIYSVERHAILVVAVAHHRRRPGYWQSHLN